jgi:TRAP-type transport system periplasmic protein
MAYGCAENVHRILPSKITMALAIILGIYPLAASAEVRLILGTGSPKESAEGLAVDKFAEIVEKKSNGQVRIRVNYQSLGVETQLVQAVMQGSVDIGTVSNGNVARFSDAYLVYDLPFLFKTYDDMLQSLDTPVGKKKIERFEHDTNTKFLMPISLGSGRDIQSRTKQLRVPGDIKGLKIRVIASPVDLETFKAWGANPTPMDYGQVYTALQQGVIDGEQISIGAVLSTKHYEVVKFSIRLDYQALFQQLFINRAKFDALAPDVQKMLVEAGEEAKVWQFQAAKDLRDRAIQDLAGKGTTVYQPTSEEYAQWAAVREHVWDVAAKHLGTRIDLEDARALYATQKK